MRVAWRVRLAPIHLLTTISTLIVCATLRLRCLHEPLWRGPVVMVVCAGCQVLQHRPLRRVAQHHHELRTLAPERRRDPDKNELVAVAACLAARSAAGSRPTRYEKQCQVESYIEVTLLRSAREPSPVGFEPRVTCAAQQTKPCTVPYALIVQLLLWYRQSFDGIC